MKTRWTESDLQSALNEAFGEITELSEQMREAFDNTPEVFQSTTGKPREEAADKLDVAAHFINCHVPAELREIDVSWKEMRAGKNGRLFRPTRRDNVLSCLRACVSRLSAESQTDEAKKLAEELEHAIDILQRVFFPGMTGRRAA